MYNKKQLKAIEMWNVATGGGKESPANVFAGIAAASGAVKYIPVPYRDFTSGNCTQEIQTVSDFLEEWIGEFKSDEKRKNAVHLWDSALGNMDEPTTPISGIAIAHNLPRLPYFFIATARGVEEKAIEAQRHQNDINKVVLFLAQWVDDLWGI